MKNIKNFFPNFEIEGNYRDTNVFGIDEAGRGPLAGPVVACCVMIRNDQYRDQNILAVNDSKKLSEKKRLYFYDYLTSNICYQITSVDNKKIDDINILNATKLAMSQSYSGILKKYDLEGGMVLVDGNFNPFTGNVSCEPIVKGDQKSISIACASIIAKVYRDKIMSEMHQQFSEFGWNKNSGYPTKSHIQAIEKFGVSCYHRLSFAPIKSNNYKKYG